MLRKAALLPGFLLAGSLVAYGVAVAQGAAQPPQTTGVATPAAKPAPHAAIGKWGFDLAGMDTKVKPGDDFFLYANGAWFAKAAIPADRTSTGSFTDLSIRSEDQVREILADLDKKQNPSDIERKVRDLYHSYTDTQRLEQLGLQPTQADMKAIADIKTYDDVGRVMGSIKMGTMSLFDAGIGVDDKNPNAYVVFVGQSGLGLPDRDYYLSAEKGTVAARTAYHKYIGDMLALGGVAEAQKKADAIFALETEIAKLHWPREDTREAEKIYNPTTLAALAKAEPQFPWTGFFTEMGIKNPAQGDRRLILSENTAFPKMAELFQKTPVATWRDYLAFHYLSSHASYLPKRFDDLRFAMYGKTLRGQAQQLERTKRGVGFLDGDIGEGVGQLYVARYFPPEAKAKAKELVANLLAVYRARIQNSDWMTPPTRAKALEKVGRFNVKIGYPDKFRDYSKFNVVAGDLFGNAERGNEFEWNRKLVRLDQPVDRSEWGMSPQTVNAYYDPSLNEIVFPAAILQPPFFDPSADDAVNYGGIGAVIGHEISHGFDDQGSKYDSTGKLNDWWTPADRKNFETRTAKLVNQYNGYSPIPNMHVNGKLTLGENIADLAGLTVTHAAYQLSLKGKPAPVLDGFTGDQRLFLGFAQVWRYKNGEADTRNRLLTDPHSPPRFRVDGATRDVDAWYAAFNVMPGQTLHLAPDQRAHLW